MSLEDVSADAEQELLLASRNGHNEKLTDLLDQRQTGALTLDIDCKGELCISLSESWNKLFLIKRILIFICIYLC